MKIFDLQSFIDMGSPYDAHFVSYRLYMSEAAANDALANAVESYRQSWLEEANKEIPGSIAHQACLRYAIEAEKQYRVVERETVD